MNTDEERELSLSSNLRFDNAARFGRIHWSPDGRFLLARAADEQQHQGIYRIDVQTGAVASIVREEHGQGAPAYGVWSADGKAIFYTLTE
jgi:Tol biopolymer transport system component